jgi:chromosome partitioning protein
MVIAIVNQKGGVGKTTTTLNLGAALAEAGRRVLLVDLDTQHDLLSFSASPTALASQVASAASGSLRIVEADVASLDSLLRDEGAPGGDATGAADFTLLDCPPALGPEVAAALRAADVALVPLQAEFLAMRGLKRLQETVEFARDPRRQGNPRLRLRIVLTMTDARDPVSTQLAADVAERFPDQVLPVVIKRSPLFASSALARESILQHSPRSHGAASFRALAREFLKESPAAPADSTAAPNTRSGPASKNRKKTNQTAANNPRPRGRAAG